MAAAIMNAGMDSVENERFDETIFSYFDKSFWYKRKSWAYAKMIGGYKIDGWHLMKSAMVVFMVLACVCFKKDAPIIVHIGIFGLLWNLTFNLFYNHLFKK